MCRNSFTRISGSAKPPQGWGNQLSNKALANLNYEYRHKLYVVKEAA